MKGYLENPDYPSRTLMESVEVVQVGQQEDGAPILAMGIAELSEPNAKKRLASGSDAVTIPDAKEYLGIIVTDPTSSLTGLVIEVFDGSEAVGQPFAAFLAKAIGPIHHESIALDNGLTVKAALSGAEYTILYR